MPLASTNPTRLTLLLLALWLGLVGLAVAVDESVATWGRDSGFAPAVKIHPATWLVKLPGEYRFTLPLALAVCFLHPAAWRAGGLVALAGIPALFNIFLKWIFGRPRPFAGEGTLTHLLSLDAFAPFHGGLQGLFATKHLAFPSGHTALAFATATALAILFPRGRWAFYAVALVVALERVAENAHYLSDVAASAGVAVLAMHAVHRLCRRLLASSAEPPQVAAMSQIP